MSSYTELLKQIETLQKQAEEIRSTERAEAIMEIREKIADYGLTAAQLGFKASGPLAGKKAAIRFRDHSGNVWSGRGHRPRWLKAELEQGKKLEDFLVA
jgi:DNA-binding protein H-NS